MQPIQLKSTWQTTKVKSYCDSNGACSNMSKHVRIRPDKHIKETEIKHVSRPPEARSKVIATATVHAQTCQNMSGYDLPNISKKQKSNMSVDLLKQDQKLLRQQRCILKHAKTCQDTPCQTYQEDKHKASNMSVDLQRVRTISYSNRSLRRQAVESKCRVRCQEVFKDSYTGQFCKRSSVAAPLASNLSVNSRR